MRLRCQKHDNDVNDAGEATESAPRLQDPVRAPAPTLTRCSAAVAAAAGRQPSAPLSGSWASPGYAVRAFTRQELRAQPVPRLGTDGPVELVDRDFIAADSNRLRVVDVTYVSSRAAVEDVRDQLAVMRDGPGPPLTRTARSTRSRYGLMPVMSTGGCRGRSCSRSLVVIGPGTPTRSRRPARRSLAVHWFRRRNMPPLGSLVCVSKTKSRSENGGWVDELGASTNSRGARARPGGAWRRVLGRRGVACSCRPG